MSCPNCGEQLATFYQRQSMMKHSGGIIYICPNVPISIQKKQIGLAKGYMFCTPMCHTCAHWSTQKQQTETQPDQFCNLPYEQLDAHDKSVSLLQQPITGKSTNAVLCLGKNRKYYEKR